MDVESWVEFCNLLRANIHMKMVLLSPNQHGVMVFAKIISACSFLFLIAIITSISNRNETLFGAIRSQKYKSECSSSTMPLFNAVEINLFTKGWTDMDNCRFLEFLRQRWLVSPPALEKGNVGQNDIILTSRASIWRRIDAYGVNMMSFWFDIYWS